MNKWFRECIFLLVNMLLFESLNWMQKKHLNERRFGKRHPTRSAFLHFLIKSIKVWLFTFPLSLSNEIGLRAKSALQNCSAGHRKGLQRGVYSLKLRGVTLFVKYTAIEYYILYTTVYCFTPSNTSYQFSKSP